MTTQEEKDMYWSLTSKINLTVLAYVIYAAWTSNVKHLVVCASIIMSINLFGLTIALPFVSPTTYVALAFCVVATPAVSYLIYRTFFDTARIRFRYNKTKVSEIMVICIGLYLTYYYFLYFFYVYKYQQMKNSGENRQVAADR